MGSETGSLPGNPVDLAGLVRNLAERGGDWRAYDETFRSLRLSNGWGWDTIHCSFPGKERTQKAVFRARFTFNRGEQCATKNCPYKHSCKQCRGNHPAVRCFTHMPNEKNPAATETRGQPVHHGTAQAPILLKIHHAQVI